jgi:rhodanese-related sulfurtransferase
MVFTLAISTILLGGCDWAGKKNGKPELILVNVLDKNLYTDCTIKGSINVPYEDVLQYALKHWDKELTHIVLFCANYKCTASGQAALDLKNRGFKHVWAYEGGTAEWFHLAKSDPNSYPIAGKCSPDISGYLDDYEKIEGESDIQIPVITAQELKDMIAKFKNAE